MRKRERKDVEDNWVDSESSAINIYAIGTDRHIKRRPPVLKRSFTD